MNEFKVNDYITLKLEGRRTNIYVKGELFNQCKFLILDIPVDEISTFDEIQSIDEAVEKLDRSLEGNNRRVIPPEVEFWGHCSNLQVWVENNYDTRLLQRTLAFPLLKKLSDIGDPIAKNVFKEEIVKRLESGTQNVIRFLIDGRYLEYLTNTEIETALENENLRKVLIDEGLNLYNLEYKIIPLLKKLIDRKSHKALEFLRELILKKGSDLEYFAFFKKHNLLNYLKKEDYDQIVPNKQLQKDLDILINLEKLAKRRFFYNSIEEFIENIDKSSSYSSHRYCIKDNQIIGLNLYQADLSEFPEIITELENLQYLILTSNKLKKIPENISDLKQLKILKLGYNQIEFVPNSIGNLKNLEELDLHSNKLKSIPNTIGGLIYLKKLDLSANLLVSIPDSIGELKSLEILNIGSFLSREPHNTIRRLPNSVSNLKRLKILNLSKNELREIPDGIGELSCLEDLNLEGNRLYKIPTAIAKLSSIKSLNLERNSIAELTESIGDLSNLESLRLSYNKIEEIPASLGNLTNLKGLSLSNNPLTKIPRSMKNLKPNIIFPILEMIAKHNTVAYEIIWDIILNTFKEGNIPEVSNLLSKRYFEGVHLDRYENILISPESNFITNLKVSLKDKDTKEPIFQVIKRLVTLGSTKIKDLLKEEISQLIEKNISESYHLTKFLSLLNEEDLGILFEKIPPEFFEGLIKTFIRGSDDANNDVIFIAQLGTKAFDIIYNFIRNTTREDKHKIILNLFRDSEYSYYACLSRENKEEFLGKLDEELTKSILEIFAEFLKQELEQVKYNIEEIYYYELEHALKFLIKENEHIWKEIYQNTVLKGTDQEVLDITLYLFIRDCFGLLSSEIIINYFERFNIENFGNTLLRFYDETNPEYELLNEKDFTNLRSLGIKLLFFLVQNTDNWEDLDWYSSILKNFQADFQEEIKVESHNYIKKPESIESDMQVEFLLYNLMPLLGDEERLKLFRDPKLKIIEKCFNLERELRYHALDHIIHFLEKLAPTSIEDLKKIIIELIGNELIPSETVDYLLKVLLKNMSEDQVSDLIDDTKPNFIDRIINKF